MAPPARPGGLDNADGVPERALIYDRPPREQGRTSPWGDVARGIVEGLVYRNQR